MSLCDHVFSNSATLIRLTYVNIASSQECYRLGTSFKIFEVC